MECGHESGAKVVVEDTHKKAEILSPSGRDLIFNCGGK